MGVRLPFGGASRSQLVLCTRQLATLVKAGMPLLRSLGTISDQLEPGPLRDVFADVARDVEAGVKLSEALSRYPRWFPTSYVNMVRAGEVGGLLDEILLRLADLLEKQQRLRERVRGALMYPAFVMVAAVGILIVLMVFVVPTFVGMFSELGSALPLPTRVLMATADIFRDWWWMVLLGMAGLGVLLKLGVATPVGRRLLDYATYHAPIFGPLVQQLLIARFARTFGTLLASGVPILLLGVFGCLVVASPERPGSLVRGTSAAGRVVDDAIALASDEIDSQASGRFVPGTRDPDQRFDAVVGRAFDAYGALECADRLGVVGVNDHAARCGSVATRHEPPARSAGQPLPGPAGRAVFAGGEIVVAD